MSFTLSALRSHRGHPRNQIAEHSWTAMAANHHNYHRLLGSTVCHWLAENTKKGPIMLTNVCAHGWFIKADYLHMYMLMFYD